MLILSMVGLVTLLSCAHIYTITSFLFHVDITSTYQGIAIFPNHEFWKCSANPVQNMRLRVKVK